MALTCPWITDLQRPRCGCADCSWEAVGDDLKQAAIDFATTYLWAATGRQFGLCEMTVRPCGWRDCNGMVEWFGWGWNGNIWQPYLWNGTWYNAYCGCDGLCCCIPDCSVRLDGPVDSIVEVTVDGVVVDPATYFVYDLQWLTRVGSQDGACWPDCSDLNAAPGPGAGVFEVTYMKGRPVPSELIYAAGVLACQWIKACQGADGCRLSQWIVSMTRQNADFQFPDPTEVLRMGLTGLREVDMLIMAYNPYGLKAPLRVFSPEIKYPRVVTWP